MNTKIGYQNVSREAFNSLSDICSVDPECKDVVEIWYSGSNYGNVEISVNDYEKHRDIYKRVVLNAADIFTSY